MTKIFIFLILVLLAIVFLWQGIYLAKEADSVQPAATIFSVRKGDGAKEIASNLENSGLIRYGFLFRVYVLTSGQSGRLKAGDYLLGPSMNIPDISRKMVSGDIIKEKITIIEGWNLRDIGFYFENKGMFQAEELYHERAEVEGYFFPDTYQIRRGATLEEIINKAADNFNKKLTIDLREEIESQGKTISEIITMASLLEKEVRRIEDKELVSGILWKRLEAGMPLQVDATITYITGRKTTEVSGQETRIDSPYNTYKYSGLPKGPICNPGLESIKAAIRPKNSDYWYYLSAPAGEGEPRPNGWEGKTIFSKTLEEHNIAKAKYLR